MPDLIEEKKYLFNSERVMIGVDEVGRGCWAGPVLSCASYIYPSKFMNLPKINDSKKMSKKHRREILKFQLDIRHKPCNFVEILPRLNET